MFELLKNSSPWDDMWRQMDALMQYPINKERSIEKTGLKSLINRPHNIVDVKDEKGETIAQRLEVVTTPFAKDDVKVYVKGNNLFVECGSTKTTTNQKDEANGDSSEEGSEDTYIYKGISTQSYSFALKLGDKVDKKGIKANNSDGILKVTLPYLKEEEKKDDLTVIEVE